MGKTKISNEESLQIQEIAYRVRLERERQIDVKGYTLEKDARYYLNGELGWAAISYIEPKNERGNWPWDQALFKPAKYPSGRIRDLEKAAALIFAEIQRLEDKYKDVFTLDKRRRVEDSKEVVEWITGLNKSGYAGCTKDGWIVDRREFPDAIPVQANSLFGVVPPKDLPKKYI